MGEDYDTRELTVIEGSEKGATGTVTSVNKRYGEYVVEADGDESFWAVKDHDIELI